MPVQTVTVTETRCNTRWQTNHKINLWDSKGQTSDWPPNICILTSQQQRKASGAAGHNFIIIKSLKLCNHGTLIYGKQISPKLLYFQLIQRSHYLPRFKRCILGCFVNAWHLLAALPSLSSPTHPFKGASLTPLIYFINKTKLLVHCKKTDFVDLFYWLLYYWLFYYIKLNKWWKMN